MYFKNKIVLKSSDKKKKGHTPQKMDMLINHALLVVSKLKFYYNTPYHKFTEDSSFQDARKVGNHVNPHKAVQIPDGN